MQNIKNFRLTTAITKEQREIAKGGTTLFLISEDGKDWYGCQAAFSQDTIKFSYDENGVITAISNNVSMLWPVGMSVAEVANTTANRRADNSGAWVFDGEKIVKRTYTQAEQSAQSDMERTKLLAKATAAIAPLQDAVDIKMASADEKASLLEWKKYRVLLSRVDVSTAPNIEWPVAPE